MRSMAAVFAFLSLFFLINPAPAAENLISSPRYSATSRGAGGVTILRGTPRQAATVAETAPVKPQIVRAGVIGTGDNLWFIDSDQRIRACWLSGTGYVNSLRVVCTP